MDRASGSPPGVLSSLIAMELVKVPDFAAPYRVPQILRDAEIANAISPIVRRYHLTGGETERFLLELGTPRAANVARISVTLGL